MGQEISESRFRRSDFEGFAERLQVETRLLEQWFRDGRFAQARPVAGIELEAWLVDPAMDPAPLNEAFLKRLDNPLAVPELAKFNVEINSTPQVLEGGALARMQAELEATFARCARVAAELDAALLTIGILPTVRSSDLSLANMSSLQRYRALNEQVLRLRQGLPLQLDIRGREHLRAQHLDVMQEAAATSLQIHLQVGQANAARYYNAAKVIAAPMVAVAANAPYLYGKDLWDETRIPLFEQAVAVTGGGAARREPRVSFGRGYAKASLLECFLDNLEHFEILLPTVFDEAPEQMAHLRLHNGTIWRWNRPLIGVAEDGGEPHLRIEHRVVSAPTSVLDTVANVALFLGLVHFLAAREPAAEAQLGFTQARDNFYAAAGSGLDAGLQWFGGRRVPARDLLRDELLTCARQGLEGLELDAGDIERYLGVIGERLASGRNGCVWQRTWVARHGPDMRALTGAYLERQRSGLPVHQWEV